MKKSIFIAALIAIILVSSEISGFLAIRFVKAEIEDAQASGILLDDDRDFSVEQIRARFADRHPILGWPTKSALKSPLYDPFGARPDPTFPYPEPFCAAAFGDSFTRSAEVDNSSAWPHLLSKMVGCRVANFGVGAYGTDQAYLRFKLIDTTSARLVILGIFPDNIMRNVNQYRGYLQARHFLRGFKPRFVFNDGKLKQIPLPGEDIESFDQFKMAPKNYLPHEYFIPGSDYGPVKIGFPYALAAMHSLFHPRSNSVLRGEPSWADFYSPNHESRAFQVTAAIVQRFFDDVSALKKLPLVYVFTNSRSIETYLDTGEWPYSILLSYLDRNEIPYVHLGDELGDYMPLEDACDVFSKESIFGCTGHHTPRGYEIVAKTIHAYALKRKIKFKERD